MTAGGVVGWQAKVKKVIANAARRGNFITIIINQSEGGDFAGKLKIHRNK